MNRTKIAQRDLFVGMIILAFTLIVFSKRRFNGLKKEYAHGEILRTLYFEHFFVYILIK